MQLHKKNNNNKHYRILVFVCCVCVCGVCVCGGGGTRLERNKFIPIKMKEQKTGFGVESDASACM